MIALTGETRAGKGTITRIWEALIRPEHTAAPSFENFSGPFGLEGFHDKKLNSNSYAQDGGNRDSRRRD